MFDGVLRFQISEKWANLRFPLNIQKQKVFQLQGGFAPLIPRPGALPLDPAEGSAPSTPLQACAPRARHGSLDCGPPAGGKLTKWPAVSKRLNSAALHFAQKTPIHIFFYIRMENI